MVDIMVEVLDRLGSERVIAFHGAGGLDELSTAGPSQVVELNKGSISRWTVEPGELGLEPAPVEALAGGTADENAVAIREVLAGQKGPKRDVVLLNAAAGLLAAGRADDLAAGLITATDAIDSGRAARALESLVEVSTST
jgi:anthranilate phosphoribosyltransferase